MEYYQHYLVFFCDLPDAKDKWPQSLAKVCLPDIELLALLSLSVQNI